MDDAAWATIEPLLPASRPDPSNLTELVSDRDEWYRGASARAAARRFDVSASSAIKFVRRWRETGSYAPGQIGGQKRRRLADWEPWLHEVMAAAPDITLAEPHSRLAENGVAVSLQTVSNTLRALGYSYKKPAGGGAR